MDREGPLTGENDSDVPTARTDAIHRSTATSLRLYQACYAAGNVLQAPSDSMMATSDPRLNHYAYRTHSSPRLDKFTQPVNEMRPSSHSHIHPYDRARNAQTPRYNGMAQLDPACHYNLDTALLTNAISHPYSRQGSVPIPLKPAASEHPSQDDTRSFALTPIHRNPMVWSQSRPSTQLESGTRSFVAPTPTTANVTVTFGYPYSTPTQSFGTRDHQSGAVASRPSPYPNPNVSTSGMLQSWDSDRISHKIRPPHPSLQRHIQRHRQYGSRKFTPKSGSPYNEPLYAPPEPAHAEGRRRPSLHLAHVDTQNNNSSRCNATLGASEWSSGIPISNPRLEGASGGQLKGPPLPSGGWAMGGPLPTYCGSAATPNTMRPMQPSSPSHIQSYDQYGNLESTLDSISGYGEQLYAPRPLYARGYGAPSSAHAHVDGHDSPHHATRESSHPAEAISFPILRNIGPTSGRDRGSTFQALSNPGDEGGVVASPPLPYSAVVRRLYDFVDPLTRFALDFLVCNIPHPQFTRQGHVPAYIGRGQAPPAPTHINNPASSFASSGGQQNDSLQNPGPSGSSAGPSTSAILARTHTDPSYVQYHNRELAAFTSVIYQSDLAVSAHSTRSFPDSRSDNVWSLQFNPQFQLPDNSPPGHTSPVQRGTPRQHTSIFTSSYSCLDAISPGLGCTMEEGHSEPSSLALADEGHTNSAGAPATYPPTTLNAQERLERALGPSSPLKNNALIKLLLLIFETPFFRTQEMEPTIDSDDGRALLRQIQQIAGCPPNAFYVSNVSIFTLFVSTREFRCLICGKFKKSMVRGLGCVRSHLRHRPYPCLGEGGCETCPKDKIVKRFFTASLLHDHCNRKERETTCTSCGTTLMSSMKRHWEAMHPDTPFPYGDYPNYHKE